MSTRIFIIAILSVLATLVQAQTLPPGYPESPRTKQRLTSAWKFALGNAEAHYYQDAFDDSAWEDVTVPHTLSLTSLALDGVKDTKAQETFQRDVGWYRRTITVGSDPSKKVFLEFEGAHQATTLWVNGQKAGQHSVSGYTPFIFDISKFVVYGQENQLTLLVDNRRSLDIPPDPGPFDFVKFSGLYRDVYLVETAPLRITFNIEGANAGVDITTPSVDPVNLNGTVNVITQVRNETEQTQNVTLVNRVVDAEGIVVEVLSSSQPVAPGASHLFNQIGGIEHGLHLWSTENPYLYKVNTLLVVDGKVVDVVDNNLGFRKFEFDQLTGFKLNNKPIKLFGFNRHQHYGYIGDALPNSLHKKDMLQFKELGFNIVRTAHYPQDDALIKACDELGILVYEEAPTWVGMNNTKQWWDNLETAARTMVRNHRNHPSIVMWGAGINHRGYVPRVHYAIKQEDPSRLTASQSSRWTGWQTSGMTDVFANMNYESGEWYRHEQILAMEGWYGPDVVAEYKNDPMKTGMISWTAHAYYTFHDIGIWDDRARLGALTVFRSLKDPILMWYPSEFKREPALYVNAEWREGTQTLTVYSNADYLKLRANGRDLGQFYPSTALKYIGLDHPPYEIPVTQFEAGRLEIDGYIDGRKAITKTLHTPGKAHALRLRVDQQDRQFVADGNDILVAYAEVVDRNGMLLRGVEPEVSFSVSGPGSIVGDKDDIGANPVKARLGTAPLLIRSGTKAGTVNIKATASGLKSASASVKTQAASSNVVLEEAYAIYDYETMQVDLGAAGQLVQFGWQAWLGEDNKASSQHFDNFGGFTAALAPVSDKGILRWLGEMNVIGPNGYVYGEGAFAIDAKGMALSLSGLPKGRYTLRTIHHAPRSNTDEMDPNLERLKTETIGRLPYTKIIDLDIKDARGTRSIDTITVSEGKTLQLSQPGAAEFEVESDGENSITLTFKDPKGEKGVWLNGFEIRALDGGFRY